MSRHLDLRPEFNVSEEDAQEMAKLRLGRELTTDEVQYVERAVSTKLYELECKMVEIEIRRLQGAQANPM